MMTGASGVVPLPWRRWGLDWASVILGAFLGVAGAFGAISLALFPLMRRSFLLWGFVRTIGYCLIAFATLPVLSGQDAAGWWPAHLDDIGIAVSAASAGPFLASYLESGLQLGTLRRRLYWAGLPALAAAVATPLAIAVPGAAIVHDILLLLTIAPIVSALTVAIRRGSRAARYQAVAWAPLIAVGFAELSYELATGREYGLWPLAALAAVVAAAAVAVVVAASAFGSDEPSRDGSSADGKSDLDQRA